MSTEAQEVKVAFQIGNATIPINSVTVTHTIDELPYAEVSVQLDNAGNPDPAYKQRGSVDIDLDKFSALNKATQEKILNQYHINADTQLVIEDGEGHQMQFKGFLGRPEFRLRDGEIFLAFTVVHAMAVLQSMNLRIYGVQEYWAHTLLHQFFEVDDEVKNIIEGNSIADRIRVMINGMLQKAAFQPDLVDPSKYDALPIHNLNLLALAKVNAFLNLSSQTTLIGGIGEPNFPNDNLLHTIYTILSEAPNFFQSLGDICSAFMLQMNADYKGSAWLEWSQINTSPNNSDPETGTITSREIRVPLQNIVFGMANIFQVPLLQVIVQAHGMDLYALVGNFGVQQGEIPLTVTPSDAGTQIKAAVGASGNSGVQLTASALYPANVPRNAVGTFALIDAPAWLHPERVSYDQITALSNTENSVTNAEDRRQVALAIDATNTRNTQVWGAAITRATVMRYMAKQQFRSLYLGGTSAQVTIPLNMQVQPGYMYYIRSVSTGKTIFKGFLMRVIHDVRIGAEGTAVAITSLTFTNVIAPGAVINALQENPTFPLAATAFPAAIMNEILKDYPTA